MTRALLIACPKPEGDATRADADAVRAYLDAALDERREGRDITPSMFSEKARRRAKCELQMFFNALEVPYLVANDACMETDGGNMLELGSPNVLARNFWLSRNGHPGFSDSHKEYPYGLAQSLHRLALGFGESDVIETRGGRLTFACRECRAGRR